MIQQDIFGTIRHITPKTEGIKYAGSKLKLLPYILDITSELEVHSVLDGFSGTTRVSQAFAQCGLNTISNDVSEWSRVFATAYLLNTKPREYYTSIIEHLNSLEGYDGWFTENYGAEVGDGRKRPFQQKNTRKLDAIRDEIDRMNLDEIEKAVALTSLIRALDSVDNTIGHYAAYLSEWSPRSYNDLRLTVPTLFRSSGENRVIMDDIFKSIGEVETDLAYFDPPYGSNNDKMPPSRVRYTSYYHIWTTVIRNDKPEIFGKVNRRADSRDDISASVFEEFRKNDDGKFIAMEAIRSLIRNTQSRYILLSYSSGGRATKEELYDILESEGSLRKSVAIDYKKNVMSGMRWTNEWINSDGNHEEFLFLIEK
jgi:adenine-specific DNA-methyltransferase